MNRILVWNLFIYLLFSLCGNKIYNGNKPVTPPKTAQSIHMGYGLYIVSLRRRSDGPWSGPIHVTKFPTAT